jgi:hypothetical protein
MATQRSAFLKAVSISAFLSAAVAGLSDHRLILQAKVSSASTNKSRSNVSNKKRQQEKAAGKRHGRPTKDCESESPLEADLDPLTKTFGALTV